MNCLSVINKFVFHYYSLLQFAQFLKISSGFAFQIKVLFQLYMLQAHLLVINN